MVATVRTAPLSRSVAVALLVTIAAAAAVRVLLQQLDPRVATVEEALVGSCLLALVGCVVWGWLGVMSVVLEASAPGSRGARFPAVPRVLRRLVLAACGVVAAGALSQAASAAGHDAQRDPLAGLPMPERAVDVAPAPARPTPSVVVGVGDCLWSLAAEDLGPRASDGDVEARWRSIYRLNRALIGPDPDLIRPGQVLELPPSR